MELNWIMRILLDTAQSLFNVSTEISYRNKRGQNERVYKGQNEDLGRTNKKWKGPGQLFGH